MSQQTTTEEIKEPTNEEATSETAEAVEETQADEAAETSAEPSVEEQLKQAQAEAQDYRDRWQRSVAELSNFKRRQEEQAKRQRDQIKASVLDGVISALDDFNMAFQHMPDDLDGKTLGWVEGLRLVQRKLDKILDDQFVKVVDTSGDFDPNLHEAVSHEPSPDHEEGQIIAELRKGYQIGSRVIRPALVRVAS